MTQVTPPRPWLAVVLTLFMPGLGHIYAGHPRRGFAFFGVLTPMGPLMMAAAVRAPMSLGLLAGLILFALVALIVTMRDALGTARRGRLRFLKRRQVVTATLGFFLFGLVVGSALDAFQYRWIGKAYRIPADSMAPTLMIGDHFFSRPFVYRTRVPERGDIVIIRVSRDGGRIFAADHRPELATDIFVKRIVGLPGDEISFRGAVLMVNGERATGSERVGEIQSGPQSLELREERLADRVYQIADDPHRHFADQSFVVEAERYFVVGDNRDYSNDSRRWGTVHRDDIIAPVGSIYWSVDHRGPFPFNPVAVFRVLRDTTRWERIGLEANR